ncbi:MAG: hypothetical protein V7L01_31625 [Nostoc sp.]
MYEVAVAKTYERTIGDRCIQTMLNYTIKLQLGEPPQGSGSPMLINYD